MSAVYVVSIHACNVDANILHIKNSPCAVRADNKEQAEFRAMQIAESWYPKSDGWEDHDVRACELEQALAAWDSFGVRMGKVPSTLGTREL